MRPDGLYYIDVDDGVAPKEQRLVVGLEQKPVYLFSVSPSGRQVAFVYQSFPTGLYVADVGGMPRKVADHVGQFSWSPDSQWLVYQRVEAADNPAGRRLTDVRVVRADGTGEREVIPPDEFSTSPSWTPSGPEILFFRYREAACCGGKADGDTYVVPLSGGTPRLLAEHLRLKAWSPDGHRAVMATPAEGASELFVVTQDGQSRTALGVGLTADGRQVWLQDGSGVLILADNKVWIVGASDGARHKVVEDASAHLGTPALSADGARVLFFRAQEVEPRRNELRIVGIDGTGERLLTDQAGTGPVQVFASVEGPTR